MLHRRSLITGLVCLIASPAIVRASSLMPVRAWRERLVFPSGLILEGSADGETWTVINSSPYTIVGIVFDAERYRAEYFAAFQPRPQL